MVNKLEKFNVTLYTTTLFFFSGFAALIYQNIWQRSFFTLLGSNEEAVTIIVSLFMLGLGLGALLGGYLERRSKNLLFNFFLIEVLVGFFGLVSLDFIEYIAIAFGSKSNIEIALSVYFVLFIPTLLMGATLPILVGFLTKYEDSIGRGLSLLYALNTLGAAVASFVAVLYLFPSIGKEYSIYVAASFNFLVGIGSFLLDKKNKRAALKKSAESSDQSCKPFIYIMLALTGFLALSQEIIWMRIASFISGSEATSFGMVLGFFLLGIAVGSYSIKNIENKELKHFEINKALIYSSIIFILTIPLVYRAGIFGGTFAKHFLYLLIFIGSFYIGKIFPLLIDLGSKNNSHKVAYLYLMNIIGSSLGPIVTGYIILEYLNLKEAIILVSISIFIVTIIFNYKNFIKKLISKHLIKISVLFISFMLTETLYSDHMERLLSPKKMVEFAYQIHSRSGIIVVKKNEPTDIVYGGGTYDGQFNLNLDLNSNGIDRAYIVPAFTRSLKNVLFVGLSTGSWLKVISEYPEVEKIDVIEINPHYQDLIEKYDQISSVLSNANVNIYHDDARRWMRNHQKSKYDLILINMTQHWKANATNLLSLEFMNLAKSMLNPTGVFYINTTGSNDVMRTGKEVFKNVSHYGTFLIGSDVDINIANKIKAFRLKEFLNTGLSIYHDRDRFSQLLENLSTKKFPYHSEFILDTSRVVTDDNMITEFH